MNVFVIQFNTATLTPPDHAVVVRTANEEWAEVVEDAHSAGAWRLALDPARHSGELDFKFMLGSRWQPGPNLMVEVTEGSGHP